MIASSANPKATVLRHSRNRSPSISRTHRFLISGSSGGGIEVLAKSHDFTVPNSKDVNKLAGEFAARFCHAPPVVSERNYLIALRHKLARIKLKHFLISGNRRKEIPDAIASGSLARQGHAG